MEYKIQIRTKFNVDRIISEVQYPQYQSDFSNIVANTATRVLELQEKGIQEALAKLGYVKQEWISVKDKLPVEQGRYLVYIDSETFIASFDGVDYWSYQYFANGISPTHWMPLPASPLPDDR